MDFGARQYQRALVLIDPSRTRAHIAIGRHFARRWNVRYAPSVADLDGLRRLFPWLELIVLRAEHRAHTVVPDVGQIRDFVPSCRIVVAAENVAPQVINATQLAGAECIALEAAEQNLKQLESVGADDAAARAVHLTRLDKRYDLTRKQLEILVFALRGYRRAEIAPLLGISHNTMKTHVRGLLRRCKVSSVGRLIAESYANDSLGPPAAHPQLG